MSRHPEQLGFDALLGDAAQDNAARAFDKETAHLPSSWAAALAFHRDQIDQHHAAMLDMDFEAAMTIRRDGHLLAKKLNGGKSGILAVEDAPGCVLARKTEAQAGTVPLWGQRGSFEIEAAGTVALIDMEGMFGIGATAMPYVSFSARAKHCDTPFISETGYRSFLGASVTPQAGMTPHCFVRRVIETHVSKTLSGKLLAVRQ